MMFALAAALWLLTLYLSYRLGFRAGAQKAADYMLGVFGALLISETKKSPEE